MAKMTNAYDIIAMKVPAPPYHILGYHMSGQAHQITRRNKMAGHEPVYISPVAPMMMTATPSAMAVVAQDAVAATATQPACLSVVLPQHLPQTGRAGVSLVQDTESPITLMGCLLAVTADFDGEGSAAASNETLATVFTEVWPYIVALFDFLCSHHRISRGLLARLHNSSSTGTTWPHSWLQLT